MENNENKKFTVTDNTDYLLVDITMYDTVDEETCNELVELINSASKKTVIKCDSPEILPEDFYSRLTNPSNLGFEINGTIIWYDDYLKSLNNSGSRQSYSDESEQTSTEGDSYGEDSFDINYAYLQEAIIKLTTLSGPDANKIISAIGGLNPCVSELPSSDIVGTAPQEINTAFTSGGDGSVDKVLKDLKTLRDKCKEIDANYEYYYNIQYLYGIDDFGEGMDDVAKYNKIEKITRELEEYDNVGAGEDQISSETHNQILEGCYSLLYGGIKNIVNKSVKTDEEIVFINEKYNELSTDYNDNKDAMSDYQLAALSCLALEKADQVEKNFNKENGIPSDVPLSDTRAQRAKIIEDLDNNTGWNTDELSSKNWEESKNLAVEKYNDVDAVYNQYNEYTEMANGSYETILRREIDREVAKNPELYRHIYENGASESDLYNLLSKEEKDFLIGRDIKHAQDKSSEYSLTNQQLNQEYQELLEKQKKLEEAIDVAGTDFDVFGDYSKNLEKNQQELEEVNKLIEDKVHMMAANNIILETIDKQIINSYTNFSNFEDLKNSRIASYEFSENFLGNRKIVFKDADGNVIDVDKEEAAMYCYVNGVDLTIPEKYNKMSGETYTPEGNREYRKLVEEVNQLNYAQNVDVKYFEVLNYLNNTGNQSAFDHYYNKKYNACVAIEGKELAQQRINKLEKNNSDLIDTFRLIGWGTSDGVVQFFNGIGNLLGNADGRMSAEQFAQQQLMQYVQTHYPQSEIQTGAYEISTSIGNMLPSIIVGLATGGSGAAIGAALMGASAAGNTFEEGLQQGMSTDEALLYGILSGASEATLSYFLGGIPGISKLGNVGHGLTGFIAKGFSEAIEEGTQEMLNPVFKFLATGEWEGIDLEAIKKAGIYAFITAGIMNGGTLIVDTTSLALTGDYTAISHIVGNNINADLNIRETFNKIKQEISALKSSETVLSELKLQLKSNEAVVSAYEQLSKQQKEQLSFDDYVSGLAIETTLQVSRQTTSETANYDAINRINTEIQNLDKQLQTIEEQLAQLQKQREELMEQETNEITDAVQETSKFLEIEEQIKNLKVEKTKLDQSINEKKSSLLSYSLETSLLNPEEIALTALGNEEILNNIVNALELRISERNKTTEIEESINTEISKLVIEQTTIEEQMQELTEQYENAKSEYERIKNDDSISQEQKNKAHEEYTDLYVRLNEVQIAFDKVVSQIDNISSDAYLQEKMESKVSELNEAMKSKKEELAQARSALAESTELLEQTPESDTETRAKMQALVDDANKIINRLDSEITEIVKEINNYDYRLLSIKSKVESKTIEKQIEEYNALENTDGKPFIIELSSPLAISLEQLDLVKKPENLNFKIADKIYTYNEFVELIKTETSSPIVDAAKDVYETVAESLVEEVGEEIEEQNIDEVQKEYNEIVETTESIVEEMNVYQNLKMNDQSIQDIQNRINSLNKQLELLTKLLAKTNNKIFPNLINNQIVKINENIIKYSQEGINYLNKEIDSATELMSNEENIDAIDSFLSRIDYLNEQYETFIESSSKSENIIANLEKINSPNSLETVENKTNETTNTDNSVLATESQVENVETFTNTEDSNDSISTIEEQITLANYHSEKGRTYVIKVDNLEQLPAGFYRNLTNPENIEFVIEGKTINSWTAAILKSLGFSNIDILETIKHSPGEFYLENLSELNKIGLYFDDYIQFLDININKYGKANALEAAITYNDKNIFLITKALELQSKGLLEISDNTTITNIINVPSASIDSDFLQSVLSKYLTQTEIDTLNNIQNSGKMNLTSNEAVALYQYQEAGGNQVIDFNRGKGHKTGFSSIKELEIKMNNYQQQKTIVGPIRNLNEGTTIAEEIESAIMKNLNKETITAVRYCKSVGPEINVKDVLNGTKRPEYLIGREINDKANTSFTILHDLKTSYAVNPENKIKIEAVIGPGMGAFIQSKGGLTKYTLMEFLTKRNTKNTIVDAYWDSDGKLVLKTIITLN